MHSEEDAKDKWCPQSHEGCDQNCIASKCMAWRDAGTEINNVGVSRKDRPRRVKVGYCGLAGKP